MKMETNLTIAGQRALQWFVDLYNAQAVPAGVLNYLWDEMVLICKWNSRS